MANEQTIANLIVKLSAQSVELATGLKKAEGSISSFVSGAQKILGGLTVGTALYKFQDAIMSVVNRAAELSKLGEKFGLPMKEFSALAAAAEHVGLSAESMGRGIKFLSKNMQDAMQGTGDAKEIFKSLNTQFEITPGVLAPTKDVILSLADTFSVMDDGATKTAIAVKLFGRAGVEMIPLLNKGRDTIEEWIAHAERMGVVMSSEAGQKAREFKLTLNEIKDATEGLTIAFASALLPTMQKLASMMQTTAESVNTLRLSMQAIVDFVESGVVLVGITLFVKWGAAITAFIATSGGLIAVIEAIGAAVTAAFVSNPATAWIALIAAALYSAYLVWKAYPPEVDKAAEAHKKLTAEIKKMKPEEQKQQIAVYTQAIADMRHEIEDAKAAMEEQRNAGDAFGTEESKKKIDEMIAKLNEYRFHLGLLKITAAKGIETPLIADPAVLDTLKKKMIELKASFSDFGPPLEKSRAAFKATLDAIVEGKGPISLYKDQVDALIAKHNEYIATETKLKVYVANIAGDLSKATSYWDSYLNDLEIDYTRGTVDLSDYFAERRRVIAEKTQAEIAALQKERAMDTTSPERKVTIDVEIKVKGEKRDADIKKSLADEAEAWKKMFATIGEGDLAGFVAKNDLALSKLENQYADGLVSVSDFFAKRRKIIEENANAAVNTEQSKIDLGLDPVAAEAASNKIKAILAQLAADLQKTNREEEVSVRGLVAAYTDAYSKIQALREKATPGGTSAKVQARYDAEIAAAKAANAKELESYTLMTDAELEAATGFHDRLNALDSIRQEQDAAIAALREEQSLKRFDDLMAEATAYGNVQLALETLTGKEGERQAALADQQAQIGFYKQLWQDANEGIWQSVSGLYSAMQTGLSNVFYGVISGTMTAQAALKGLGQSMLKIITDYLAKRLLAFLFEKSLLVAQVASAIGAAAAIAAALIPIQAKIAAGWAVGAASASIATYGAAAAEGAAAYLAALATAVAGAAAIQASSAAAGAVAMEEGGPVTSGSGTKDDVPALLTRGEYVQTKKAVDYYGLSFMEAIRRRMVPREITRGFNFFPVVRPQFAFAGGGAVSGGGAASDRGSATSRRSDPGGDLNMVFYLDGEPFFKVIDKGIRDGRLKTYKLVPV